MTTHCLVSPVGEVKEIPAKNRFFCKNGDIILEKNIDKQQVKLRAKDGIHLSIAGAKIIAQKIIESY